MWDSNSRNGRSILITPLLMVNRRLTPLVVQLIVGYPPVVPTQLARVHRPWPAACKTSSVDNQPLISSHYMSISKHSPYINQPLSIHYWSFFIPINQPAHHQRKATATAVAPHSASGSVLTGHLQRVFLHLPDAFTGATLARDLGGSCCLGKLLNAAGLLVHHPMVKLVMEGSA